MNYGNEDTRYFGGIPSSIISYSSDRGRYQAYDGIYDINTTTSQQLVNLQDQVSILQKQIYSLQNTKVSQQLLSNPNLLTNGDCSQFTLLQPIFGTVNAGANNAGLQLQGRAVPIMDRWYHVAELAGANPTNLKFECSQVLLSAYINPIAPLESIPQICTYGMKCVWKHAAGATSDMFYFEHYKSPLSRIVDKFGAVLAVQHMIPNVKLTINKSYTMGFWLYTNYTSKGMIRILRQYNHNGGGGNSNTSNSLEHIYIKTFNFSVGWNYISAEFATTTLGSQTISGMNGLVVQIGPFYYNWKDNAGNVSFELYGDAPGVGQSSYEWVLAEIQLRSDSTIAGKTNFIVNPKEYENTLPYICGTSSTGIDVLGNMNSRVPSTTISAGSPKPHTVTITFDTQIRLPVKMIQTPGIIIYNTIDTLLSKAIGGYFTTASAYTQDSATGPMWNGMKLLGLTFSYDAKVIFSNASEVAYHEPIPNIGGWPLNGQITFMTDKSFRFTFYTTYSYTNSNASEILVDNPVLYFSGGNMAKFVAIVPETQMGKQDQSELLTYVDFSWTALTSRPFPITI